MKKILALAALAASISSGAFAQGFPNKPISFVVPFAAGGPTDLVARRLAEAMRKPLGGANIVVENAAGAGLDCAAAGSGQSQSDPTGASKNRRTGRKNCATIWYSGTKLHRR